MSHGPLRRFLERRIGGRNWLRAQTAMVLMLCFLAGALASRGLLQAGVEDMRWRLPLTVLATYLVFLLLVRGWLHMTGVGGEQVKLDPKHVEQDQEQSAARDFAGKLGDVADGVIDVGDIGGAVADEGCLPAIGFVLLLGVLIAVLSVLWWFFGGFFGAASAALIEAGVEAVLAAGMARAAGGNALQWMHGAVRVSWKYWFLLGVVAYVLAAFLHVAVPEARTLGEALRMLVG